jgi:hypothetical protein
MTLRERFDSMWVGVPESGCWIWTGNQNYSGYGLLAATPGRGPRLRAHRVSFEIHNGPIGDGLSVLHKCDVRLCVNPAHLFLGTQADNVADAKRKGKFPSKYAGDPVAVSERAERMAAYQRDYYIRNRDKLIDYQRERRERKATEEHR